MSKAVIYTDGGSRGNPGPAAIGAVVQIDGTQHLFKKYIGITTNNQAEYQAILLGLEKAQQLGATEAECYLDSELVQKQLTRQYKVKHADIQPWFVKVWNISQHFKKISFTHVLREKNKIADKLVNEALDEAV